MITTLSLILFIFYTWLWFVINNWSITTKQHSYLSPLAGLTLIPTASLVCITTEWILSFLVKTIPRPKSSTLSSMHSASFLSSCLSFHVRGWRETLQRPLPFLCFLTSFTSNIQSSSQDILSWYCFAKAFVKDSTFSWSSFDLLSFAVRIRL